MCQQVDTEAATEPTLIHLQVYWDKYCQSDNPKMICNLFRIVEFCDYANQPVKVEPFVQWCNDVTMAATFLMPS